VLLPIFLLPTVEPTIILVANDFFRRDCLTHRECTNRCDQHFFPVVMICSANLRSKRRHSLFVSRSRSMMIMTETVRSLSQFAGSALELDTTSSVSEATICISMQISNLVKSPTRRKTMNWDRIEGNWKQLKGKAKEQWGKLTDDELDVAAGKRDQLVGAVQNKYGIAKDEAEKQIDDWANRHNM
jgi:uncharacterized protein YjbJ (UPF0337 family)